MKKFLYPALVLGTILVIVTIAFAIKKTPSVKIPQIQPPPFPTINDFIGRNKIIPGGLSPLPPLPLPPLPLPPLLPGVKVQRRKLPDVVAPATKALFTCDNTLANKKMAYEPFRVITINERRTGVGAVTLSGIVFSHNDYIYFLPDVGNLLTESQQVFYDWSVANVYGLDRHAFEIGVLLNKKINTTATISNLTESYILEAIGTGSVIELTLYIPVEYPYSTPQRALSKACRIEKEPAILQQVSDIPIPSTQVISLSIESPPPSCDRTLLNKMLTHEPFSLMTLDGKAKGVGSVTLWGKVSSRNNEVYFQQDRFPHDTDSPMAFYKWQAQAPFKLGVLKNNTLVSTARLNETTESYIVEALNKNKSIKLTIRIPAEYLESTDNAAFSKACDISGYDFKKFFACDNSEEDAKRTKEPYHLENIAGTTRGVGVVNVRGTIVSEEEEMMEVFTAVKLLINKPEANDPAKLLYDELVKRAPKGKEILPFYLGILEGGRLNTTATLSEATEQRILNAMNTDMAIDVTLRIPSNHYEFGLPSNFSEACSIE